MARKHRTLTLDGQELISLPGLAAELGRTPMTVRRWMRDGKLPPPDVKIPKPGLLRNGHENYFTKEQVQDAFSVLAREEQRQAYEKTPLITKPQLRPWREATGDSAAATPARRWNGTEPAGEATPEPEPLTSERCPHCGGKDLVWHHDQIRGAHPSLNQRAVCQHCNLRVTPEPVFDPPRQPTAWGRDFTLPPAALPQVATRRRPAPLTHVHGAVRLPKPQSRSRVEIPMDPL